jgi:hypothetical protein
MAGKGQIIGKYGKSKLKCQMIWKIGKIQKTIVKRYGKYGRKASRIVKRFGKD